MSVAPVAVPVAHVPEDEQPHDVDAQAHSTHDQQLVDTGARRRAGATARERESIRVFMGVYVWGVGVCM